MIIVGLTGSMASGKSTVAQMFHRLGCFVSASDDTVAALYQQKDVQHQIAALLPRDFGTISRSKIVRYLIQTPCFLPQLEKILHPLVENKHAWDIQQARQRKEALIVLEVPLLFEMSWHVRCDFTLLVTCASNLQYNRVMTRVGMTKDKFEMLQSRQWPESQKRSLADFILDTSQSRLHTYHQLKLLLKLDCFNNKLETTEHKNAFTQFPF